MDAPPVHVIRAFGQRAAPVRLAGGRGTSWRVGDLVLKPADLSPAEIEWQATILAAARPQDLRLVVPLRSADAGYLVEGWMATPYVEAAHQVGRWLDILAVGRRLASALAEVPRPDFLDGRRTPWDVADRVAWEEEPIAPFRHYPHIDALARLRRPIFEPAQVIHGDLSGNVLFADGVPATVIDFVAYWRPAAYAGAIVIADALAWEGAPDDLVGALDGGVDAAQLLVRALLFRALAEVVRQPGMDPNSAAQPFGRAVHLATALLNGSTPVRLT